MCTCTVNYSEFHFINVLLPGNKALTSLWVNVSQSSFHNSVAGDVLRIDRDISRRRKQGRVGQRPDQRYRMDMRTFRVMAHMSTTTLEHNARACVYMIGYVLLHTDYTTLYSIAVSVISYFPSVSMHVVYYVWVDEHNHSTRAHSIYST